jgi:hypothetical protein
MAFGNFFFMSCVQPFAFIRLFVLYVTAVADHEVLGIIAPGDAI